jgi:hypothetical protein
MQRQRTTLCWLAGLGLLVGAAGAGQAMTPATPEPAAPSAPAGATASTGAEKAPGKAHRSQKIVVMDDGAGDRRLGKPVARGYLGVGLTDLTPELRAHFGVPQEAGVMVSKVDAGSPAEKAGLKVGDVVTAIDGKPIATSFDLRQRIRGAEDGAAATVEVWRGGKVQTLTANLEKRERPELDLAPLFIRQKDGDRMVLSLDGADLPDRLARPFLPLGAFGNLRGQATLSSREAELEKRLKELEKRLRELERQLGAGSAPAPKH